MLCLQSAVSISKVTNFHMSGHIRVLENREGRGAYKIITWQNARTQEADQRHISMKSTVSQVG